MTDTGTSALDPNPFEIIDSPWGHVERWRASTLSTGTMGALAQVYDIVRADADAAVVRVEETEARKALVLEARHKADAEHAEREEQERLFDEEPIPEPPGTVGPSVAADQPASPGGELHDLPAKDQGELPDPPLGVEDNIGDLPEELRDLPEPTPPPKGKVFPQPIAIQLNEE